MELVMEEGGLAEAGMAQGLQRDEPFICREGKTEHLIELELLLG